MTRCAPLWAASGQSENKSSRIGSYIPSLHRRALTFTIFESASTRLTDQTCLVHSIAFLFILQFENRSEKVWFERLAYTRRLIFSSNLSVSMESIRNSGSTAVRDSPSGTVTFYTAKSFDGLGVQTSMPDNPAADSANCSSCACSGSSP